MSIRIATRKSPLALWQAEYVKACLEKAHPDISIEIIGMSTRGDKILDTPLAKIGGKGLFIKELEVAILNNKADIAVHSMKDVPVEFPNGLGIATIMRREDPRDAFVSNRYQSLDQLPQNAKVGTASLRRQCQLLESRPDLEILPLRGNVNTRLAKLDAGAYDAIILASAGLKRLGYNKRITSYMDTEQCLPAIGQGAVGIECRLDDDVLVQMLEPLKDKDTTVCVTAERALNEHLHGGCQVPLAGHAILKNDRLEMSGLVGEQDGSKVLRASGEADRNQAQELGTSIAEDLLNQGADRILKELYKTTSQ